MSDIQPLGYLLLSSKISIESYELLRLNRASNLRKQMLQLLDEWVDAETEARLAREILEWKGTQHGLKSHDDFSTVEQVLTNKTGLLTGGGAKFLCAATNSVNMARSQKMMPPKEIGAGFRVNRPRPKFPQRMRPAAMASLALRFLEGPPRAARDNGQIFGEEAIFSSIV